LQDFLKWGWPGTLKEFAREFNCASKHNERLYLIRIQSAELIPLLWSVETLS
jgi:hypothetical protein